MPVVKFSISALSQRLLERAKSRFDHNERHSFSDDEIQEVFSKMLAIENNDDNDETKEILDNIGWFDEDCFEPGSRLDNFTKEGESKQPEKKRRKRK